MDTNDLPGDIMVISDLETLKVLSDPLRLNILELIKGGFTTVKEIAAQLDREPTKLYYHVNLLEKHALILIADTRIVSGIVEKHYALAADGFTVDHTLLDLQSEEGAESSIQMFDAVFERSRQELVQGMRSGLIRVEDKTGPHSMEFSRMRLHLSPEDIGEFHEEIAALFKRFTERDAGEDAEGTQTYTLLLTFYPVELPRRQDQTQNTEE